MRLAAGTDGCEGVDSCVDGCTANVEELPGADAAFSGTLEGAGF